jgi:ADP-heptose:LPS heptosyltransferase
MKTIVLIPHGIGDVIMALPLLRAITQKPNDKIMVLVKSRLEGELLELTGLSNKKIYISILNDGNFFSKIKLIFLLIRFRADSIVNGFGVDPMKAGFLSFLSNSKYKITSNAGAFGLFFSHNVTLNDTTHKVEYYHQVICLLGRSTVKIENRLNLFNKLPKILPRYVSSSVVIALAFGSGGVESHKRLPKYLAQDLTLNLQRVFPLCTIILLGGHAERSLNKSIEDLDGFNGVNLTGITSIEETISILSISKVLVACCNGVSHMASLVDLPVVGLYGPTDPRVTSPWGVDLSIVSRKLSCSPCYSKDFITGCGNPICMEFTVKEIVEQVDKVIEL